MTLSILLSTRPRRAQSSAEPPEWAGFVSTEHGSVTELPFSIPPEGRQAGGDSADRHLEVRKSAEHRNMARCLLEVTQVPNTHGVSTDTLGLGQIPVIKI